VTKSTEELKERAAKAVKNPTLVEFAKTAPLNSDGRVNLSWAYEQAFEYVYEETGDLQKARELAVSTRWLAMLRRDHEEEFQVLISGRTVTQKKLRVVNGPSSSDLRGLPKNLQLRRWIGYWEQRALDGMEGGNFKSPLGGYFENLRTLKGIDLDLERMERILGTQVHLSSGGNLQVMIDFSIPSEEPFVPSGPQEKTRVFLGLPGLDLTVESRKLSIHLFQWSQVVYEEGNGKVGFGFRVKEVNEDYSLHFVRISKDGTVSVDWRNVRT